MDDLPKIQGADLLLKLVFAEFKSGKHFEGIYTTFADFNRSNLTFQCLPNCILIKSFSLACSFLPLYLNLRVVFIHNFCIFRFVLGDFTLCLHYNLFRSHVFLRQCKCNVLFYII